MTLQAIPESELPKVTISFPAKPLERLHTISVSSMDHPIIMAKQSPKTRVIQWIKRLRCRVRSSEKSVTIQVPFPAENSCHAGHRRTQSESVTLNAPRGRGFDTRKAWVVIQKDYVETY